MLKCKTYIIAQSPGPTKKQDQGINYKEEVDC